MFPNGFWSNQMLSTYMKYGITFKDMGLHSSCNGSQCFGVGLSETQLWVRTGPGNPGKSWIFKGPFSRPGKWFIENSELSKITWTCANPVGINRVTDQTTHIELMLTAHFLKSVSDLGDVSLLWLDVVLGIFHLGTKTVRLTSQVMNLKNHAKITPCILKGLQTNRTILLFGDKKSNQ